MVICHSHSSHSSFVACTCSESPVFTAAQFKQMNTYTTKSTKSKRFCGLAEQNEKHNHIANTIKNVKPYNATSTFVTFGVIVHVFQTIVESLNHVVMLMLNFTCIFKQLPSQKHILNDST